MLTADAVGKDGKEHTSCFVAFDDALEMYYDSQEEIIKRPPYINRDKDQFMYALLHEQWGLCVYILTHEDRKKKDSLLCDLMKWIWNYFWMIFARKVKIIFLPECIWTKHLCRVCFHPWIQNGTKLLHES